MKTAAIIPAWNEEATIAGVVHAALDADSVDEVIVVDNNSTDMTATEADLAGARVVHEPAKGKGQAMAAGVAATDADLIVFLDADLLHLCGSHIDELVRPVAAGDADMACGLFDRGPAVNPFFVHALPVLTGQRALRRELFESLAMDDIKGYKVEAALNSLIAQRKLRRLDVVLEGLWHRTKEEKFDNPVEGFAHKVAMLTTASWSYVSYAAKRRLPAERAA